MDNVVVVNNYSFIQYDGDWTAEPVKKRIIQCMYSWSVGLPKETKIAEAYKMLKTQGTVTEYTLF